MQLSTRLVSNLWTALFVLSLLLTIYLGYQFRLVVDDLKGNKNIITNSIIVKENGKFVIENKFNTNSYVVDVKLDYYIKRSDLMKYHKKHGFPKYWTDTGIDRPGQTLYLNNKESVDSLIQMLNVIISTE